jgi:hypothetical protein
MSASDRTTAYSDADVDGVCPDANDDADRDENCSTANSDADGSDVCSSADDEESQVGAEVDALLFTYISLTS